MDDGATTALAVFIFIALGSVIALILIRGGDQ